MNKSEEKQTLLERLLTLPNAPNNRKEQSSKIEPMASFRMQIEYGGKLTKFYNVNMNIGASGPAAYVPEPTLTISTLYPEDDKLVLETLIRGDLEHPLLYAVKASSRRGREQL